MSSDFDPPAVGGGGLAGAGRWAVAVVALLTLSAQSIEVLDESRRVGVSRSTINCVGDSINCTVAGSALKMTVGAVDGGSFNVPVMARSAFPSAGPNIGGLIFDSTAGILRYSDGTQWLHAVPGNPDGGPVQVQAYSAFPVYGTLNVNIVDAGTVPVGGMVTAEMPSLTVARTGMLNGKAAYNFNILGKRSQGWSSTTALGDCGEYIDTTQAGFNATDGGTTYYIRSSSANDTEGGTGARTVRIFYLRSGDEMSTMTATMNGTTPVSLGNGINYVEWAEVATTGTGGVSAGNITISSESGGAPAVNQIVEYIAAGGNRSMSGRFRVPAGHKAYLKGWSLTNVGTATMDARLRVQAFSDDRTFSEPFHFNESAYMSSASEVSREIDYLRVPALAEIKTSAIPSNATSTNRLDCDFHLLLIQD